MPTCRACGNFVPENQSCRRCGPVAMEHTLAESVRVLPVAATPLCPVRRPPTPRLIVLDDDSDQVGEVYWLRRTETRLGRHQSDVVIGHDPDISSCHAKILREESEPAGYRWRLIDDDSTNGTFVRQSTIKLDADTTFLLGGVPVVWRKLDEHGTSLLQIGDRPADRLTASMTQPILLGRDPRACQIAWENSWLDERHAILTWRQGHWYAEDQQTVNGLWAAVRDYVLPDQGRFILGEQRFLFQMPTAK